MCGRASSGFLGAAILGFALVLAMSTPLGAQISPGPLAKAHRELEGALNCVKCHGARKEPMAAMCQSCHKDIEWMIRENRGLHARQAGTGAGKKECQSCHPDHAGTDFEMISWPGGSKTKFDHAQAGWALEGAHAEVECEKCHTQAYRVSAAVSLSRRKTGAGWIGLETTCVSCHRDDDQHKGSLGGKCQSCHDVKEWERAPKFDHDASRYPLTGKHANVKCAACHESPRLSPKRDAKGEVVPVYRPVSFGTCASCHDDPHKGRLGAKCADCHSTKSFESVDKRDFNHSLTRYPLKGKHIQASCASCHGASMARPRPAYGTCASCHTDAHNGTASLSGKPSDCAACHRVEGFAPSTYTAVEHRTAPYALEGKHLQVSCSKCHTTTTPAGARASRVTRIRMASRQCGDCHADAHAGQLASRNSKGACETCHAVAGWKPSTFTVAQHASLRLALDGRHATLTCAACHGVTRPGLPALAKPEALGTAHVAVALADAECSSCHVDAHDGRYAKGALATPAGCRGCHNTTAFRPTLLTPAGHDRFRFPIEGAHRAVPCVGCHEELKAPAATATLLLSAKGVTRFPGPAQRARASGCVGCHESPHGTQFAGRKGGETCETCHGADAFAPAARFNHDTMASFSLKGAHARVACASCHKAEPVAGGKPRVRYRPLSAKCESCHATTPKDTGRLQ